MISKIFEELRRSFSLKKNHLLILKLLSAEECTADEVCERTSIPKGRIYNLLNELIAMQLILRKEGVPAIYRMGDPRERVLDFLKHDFEEELRKHSMVMSLLEEDKEVERMEMLSADKKSYDYNAVGLISQASWLKLIHRKLSVSWFLQIQDEAEFWKIRSELYKSRMTTTTPSREILLLKYKTYKKFYETGTIEEVMTKATVDEYVSIIKRLFGEKRVKELARQVIRGLKEHQNIKLYILDATPSFISTYLSDKMVLTALVFRGEVSGMKLFGKKPVELYKKYFDELKANSRPLEEYLEKLL